jgi:hypothetical protein
MATTAQLLGILRDTLDPDGPTRKRAEDSIESVRHHNVCGESPVAGTGSTGDVDVVDVQNRVAQRHCARRIFQSSYPRV